MELNNYLIDTVEYVNPNAHDTWPGGGVKMKTYRVAASTAEAAMNRFADEEAGEVIYEGELANFIIIGIQKES